MRQRAKQIAAGLISLAVLALNAGIYAVPATAADMPAHSSASSAGAYRSAGAAQGMNFDLSSTQATLPAPSFAATTPVNIQVAGISTAVNRDSVLTPAQRLAAFQVFRTGQQSIILGELGNAVGGSFALGPRASQMLSNLVIPAGVTAVKDFGRSASLNVAGNLTNAGSFYAYSSNPAVTTANINAANIANLAGGLISSVLPSGGLPGIASAVSNLNLNLNAVHNIINQGTISSSGNLAMSAGGSITNQAVMSAAQNINLMTGSGNVTNSGLIAAALGNINVSSTSGLNLLINNTNGTLQALRGSINASAGTAANAALNLRITGGDILTQELNLTACQGVVNVNVENLTGRVNVAAGEVHVDAATPNLVLGNMTITGDPTFFNQNGNVTIDGDLIFNSQTATLANLAIVASGDILTGPGAGQINTSGTNTSAGSVLMVAGANFSVDPDDTTSVTPTSSSPGDTVHTLTITNGPGSGGGTMNGGKIDLQGTNPISSFNTSVTSGSGNGGDVTLIAFAGQSAGSGSIKVPLQIQTGTTDNSPSATNGNVLIIAGGGSISLFGLNTSGNTNSTQSANGTISIFSAKPVISAGGVLVNAGAGTPGNPIFTGTFSPDPVLHLGVIATGTLTTMANATIATAGPIVNLSIIASSASIVTPTISTSSSSLSLSSNVTLTSSSPINITAGAGGNLSLQSNSGITVLPPPASAPTPPPIPVTTSTVASAPPAPVVNFSAQQSSSTASNAILNAQLSTKISTDVTQLGTLPTSQPGPMSAFFIPTGTTPYTDLGIGGGSAGWKNSDAGSIWSCTGCLGSLPQDNNTQNAVRVIQKLSDDIAGNTNEVPIDEAIGEAASCLHRAKNYNHLVALAGTESDPGVTQEAADDTKSGVDFFDLKRGVAMFHAKSPVVVGTMEGKVHIEKGSLGFVIETGHDVAIYNLHDRRSGGIKVVVGKSIVHVPPGKQLVLTRELDANFDKINPSSKIGYRNPTEIKFTDGIKGFLADFSIPAAIFTIPPLKKMLKSPKPEERQIASQLLKNAAILADITAGAGPFMNTK